MISMHEELRNWKPGHLGGLPKSLDQAALLVFDPPLEDWALPGGHAQAQRDEARRKVIAIVDRFWKDAFITEEAEASLAEAFQLILVGDREIGERFQAALKSYAGEVLETLYADAEFTKLTAATKKKVVA